MPPERLFIPLQLRKLGRRRAPSGVCCVRRARGASLAAAPKYDKEARALAAHGQDVRCVWIER